MLKLDGTVNIPVGADHPCMKYRVRRQRPSDEVMLDDNSQSREKQTSIPDPE